MLDNSQSQDTRSPYAIDLGELKASFCAKTFGDIKLSKKLTDKDLDLILEQVVRVTGVGRSEKSRYIVDAIMDWKTGTFPGLLAALEIKARKAQTHQGGVSLRAVPHLVTDLSNKLAPRVHKVYDRGYLTRDLEVDRGKLELFLKNYLIDSIFPGDLTASRSVRRLFRKNSGGILLRTLNQLMKVDGTKVGEVLMRTDLSSSINAGAHVYTSLVNSNLVSESRRSDPGTYCRALSLKRLVAIGNAAGKRLTGTRRSICSQLRAAREVVLKSQSVKKTNPNIEDVSDPVQILRKARTEKQNIQPLDKNVFPEGSYAAQVMRELAEREKKNESSS